MALRRSEWCALGIIACYTVVVLLPPHVACYSDPFFPQYHVRPPSNWINDPNGPFRDPKTNVMHLWMQYNPDGPVWGNMSWFHCATEDYVHWKRLGVTLTNDAPYDAGGVFSGSVSLDVNQDPVIFYTCVDANGVERQCAAVPNDRDGDLWLLNWTKSPNNPVVASLANEVGLSNFRDPLTGWMEVNASTGASTFYFATGASVRLGGPNVPPLAAIPIFATARTDSLPLEIFDTGALLFHDPNILSGMIECPDFFQLPRHSDGGFRHVVKVSNNAGKDMYYIGAFNASSLTFDADDSVSPVWVDYGTWYASKSFFDEALQQRILFGWINEEDHNFTNRGWAGMQSLPRVVTYDDTFETVRTAPLPALASLRNGPLGSPLNNVSLSGQDTPTCVVLVPPNASDSATAQEIMAEFSVPLLTLDDRRNNDENNGTLASFHVEIRVFVANESRTRVTLLSNLPGGGLQWNNTDQPGGDFRDYPLTGDDENADIANCSAACAADRRCLAWSYVRRGFNGSFPFNYAPRCSLKSELVDFDNHTACCVTGRPRSPIFGLDRADSGSTGSTSNLQGRAVIVPDPYYPETRGRVKLHVFVDQSVVEAFKDDGLERVTGRVYPISGSNGVSICGACAGNERDGRSGSSPEIVLTSATAFSVGTIWST